MVLHLNLQGFVTKIHQTGRVCSNELISNFTVQVTASTYKSVVFGWLC